MDKKTRDEVIALFGQLSSCLRDRELYDLDQLFSHNARERIDNQRSELEYGTLMGYDDEKFCKVINIHFALVLHGSAKVQKAKKCHVNDDAGNLATLITTLERISAIGVAGKLNDPNYRISAMISEITTWLKAKQRLLNEVNNLQLPVFIRT